MGIEGSAPGRLPGLSVVVAALAGDDPADCLESLAQHCQDPELLEVLLVGSTKGSPLQKQPPAMGAITVRRLRLPGAEHGRALALGLRSARREFVTFLHPGDRVTSEGLSSIADLVRPDEISALRAAPGGPPAGSPLADPGYAAELPGLVAEPAGPRLADALAGSARWVVPTWLAADAGAPTRTGQWWELVLMARILCSTRTRPRWATDRSSAPDVVSSTHVHEVRWGDVDALLSAMAELEALAIEEPGCAEALAPSVRGLARLLRPLLAADPDRRPDLMDAILASPVLRFPFGELQGEPAEDLVIAYAFPPSRDSSAVVAARRVRERGRVADVISCDLASGHDPGTQAIAGGFVGRHAQLVGPASYGHWPDVEAFAVSGLRVAQGWVEQGRRYRRLYSRSMWPASHVLAALVKHRNPEVAWSAEFSDPMQRTIRGRPRYDAIDRTSPVVTELGDALRGAGLPQPGSDNLWEWVEHLAFALADEVVFTNANQRDLMLAGVARTSLRERVRGASVIRAHPTPPECFYGRAAPVYGVDRTLLNLAYFGRFYPTRGIGEVLDALRACPEPVRACLHLHVFSDDPEGVRSQARQAGVARNVTSNPAMDYFDFLAMTRRFDLLVVNDAETRGAFPDNPYLPSKLSDYLGSGNDIWAIYEPGSPMSAVPVRFRSALGDADAACEILIGAAAERLPRTG